MQPRLSLVPLLTCLALPAAAAPTAEEMLAAARAEVHNVDTAELREIIASRPDVVLIDVRTQREILLRGGSIDAPRSLVIPRGWLELRIAGQVPDRDTPIVVYCGINERSPLAARTLMEMGYTNVSNYMDGTEGWQAAGLPMDVPDKALDSILYERPRRVTENVWSAIGATAPPTYANSGHNNNLSFIVTGEGVVVVNAGDNDLLAQALHAEIREITDQPVRYVVLENGQGHAMLGSGYWKDQGAVIVAHADAAAKIAAQGEQILERMRQGRRDKALGTRVVLPEETFEDRRVLELGGTRIELLDLGPAHSPGDISVWLPEQRLVIAGDIAFHQRMLPVFEGTDTAAWIDTWEAFEALEPEVVIPGHGEPTSLDVVTRYTRDYLVYMRDRVRALLDAGGTLQEAYAIDQSPYAHLDTFDELAGLNADRIFRAMEFE